MDWTLILIMLPLAVLSYWAGFVATARYRKNKHKFKDQEGGH